jgi:hypothetical protein
MQESAVANYRAFLATAECAAEAHQGAEAAAAALDALGAELPELGAAATAFSRSAAALLAAKARNKQLQGTCGLRRMLWDMPEGCRDLHARPALLSRPAAGWSLTQLLLRL